MSDLKKQAKHEAEKCFVKDCRICYLSTRQKQVLESADFALMAEFIDELLNRECDLSEDLSYHKAILDGTWPNSVEILTKKLAKAKENPNFQAEVFAKVVNILDRKPECT
jgi:hypothetical protein